jgi:hypothetical protein
MILHMKDLDWMSWYFTVEQSGRKTKLAGLVSDNTHLLHVPDICDISLNLNNVAARSAEMIAGAERIICLGERLSADGTPRRGNKTQNPYWRWTWTGMESHGSILNVTSQLKLDKRNHYLDRISRLSNVLFTPYLSIMGSGPDQYQGQYSSAQTSEKQLLVMLPRGKSICIRIRSCDSADVILSAVARRLGEPSLSRAICCFHDRDRLSCISRFAGVRLGEAQVNWLQISFDAVLRGGMQSANPPTRPFLLKALHSISYRLQSFACLPVCGRDRLQAEAPVGSRLRMQYSSTEAHASSNMGTLSMPTNATPRQESVQTSLHDQNLSAFCTNLPLADPSGSAAPPEDGPDSNLPLADTNMPLADTKMPLADTKMPLADTNMPLADTNMPLADTNMPPADTNMPLANTDLPLANTDLPPADTNLPPADTNLPPADQNKFSTGRSSPLSQIEGSYLELVIRVLDKEQESKTLDAEYRDELSQQLKVFRVLKEVIAIRQESDSQLGSSPAPEEGRLDLKFDTRVDDDEVLLHLFKELDVDGNGTIQIETLIR